LSEGSGADHAGPLVQSH